MSVPTEPGLPDWGKDTVHRFTEYHKRIHDFYHLTMIGLRMVVGQTESLQRLVEKIRRLDGMEEELKQAEQMLGSSTTRAQAAQAELKQGSPTLHEHLAISLWSSLEWFVQDLAAGWIANRPSTLKLEAVRRVRIRLADYEQLVGNEKYAYVIDALERELGSAFRQGVDRFESLLATIALAGDVDGDVRKTLFELGQVRNVLVHRGGIADSRMVHACPWLGIKVGERVSVNEEAYEKYFAAVFDYAGVLIDRAKEKLSAPD